MGDDAESNADHAEGAAPLKLAAAPAGRSWRTPAIWLGANALLALVALWAWMTPLPQLGAPPQVQPTATVIIPQLATASPGLAPTTVAGTPYVTATAGSAGGGAKPTATPTRARPTPTATPTRAPTATPIPPTPTATPGNQG